MSTFKQLIHIFRTFGAVHTLQRIADALRAKINEWSRSRRHRKRMKRLGYPSSLTVSCLGKQFKLRADDLGLHRDLIADRIREPVATSLMLQYAKSPDVLLDAGANIGYFSLALADKCKKVYSIEPDLRNFDELNQNIDLNNVTNISTFNLAFSDKSEKIYLNPSDKANWHTTSKEPITAGREVEAVTVDEFCRGQNITPTMMKMDIEGFERFVIPGASFTLTHLNTLFFELHSAFLTIEETNKVLDIVNESGLILRHLIRYDRPGLWKEEPLESLEDIRNGDFGIYELIYCRS